MRSWRAAWPALAVVLAWSGLAPGQAQTPPETRAAVKARVEREYTSLFELYKHLHATPELSLQEEKTAARIADELRRAGFEVTTGIARHGVVGVLRNGNGPTVMVRTDLDALPVKEQTGLPYASTVTAKDFRGAEVPVMHACGHDLHMTCFIGTARVLAGLKDRWRGTLILIGQPAEEAGGGAHAMLADGLFQRFPRPDYCLALHDNAELPAGTLGYTPGYDSACVDSAEIIVHGIGGHGAYPHKTKDPIVLASQIVLALQTIASREIRANDPVVVTVGSIHGGTKNNIIPDEVRLLLTIRTYSDEVRRQTFEAIKRIARGQAVSAGLPDSLLPEVRFAEDPTPALYNQPELTERIAGVFKTWFGETNVVRRQPGMGGEDFSEYGRVEPKIPICIFALGAARSKPAPAGGQSSQSLPSLHSPFWAPVPEPAIKTGVTAMSAAVLELIGTK